MSADVPTKPTPTPAYWEILWSVCAELQSVRVNMDAQQLDWAMNEVRTRLMARQGGKAQVNGRVS